MGAKTMSTNPHQPPSQPPPAPTDPPPIYTYKPAWVANNFIVQARDEGVGDVDPLKIQKLVYNFHGWYLATTGHPAVGDRFEAWPKGPVLSSLYHQFKHYRWNPIKELAVDVDPLTGESRALYVPPSDETFQAIFNRVWHRYRHLSGSQLSVLTHAPDTPWSKARERGQQYIDDVDIRAHFIELAKRLHG